MAVYLGVSNYGSNRDVQPKMPHGWQGGPTDKEFEF